MAMQESFGHFLSGQSCNVALLLYWSSIASTTLIQKSNTSACKTSTIPLKLLKYLYPFPKQQFLLLKIPADFTTKKENS